RYARYVLQDINEDCTTLTVNYEQRIRKTWNPGEASAGLPVSEIALFGGSTMEGLGAPDDETIPSHVSKLLNAAGSGRVFHVTNYGVSGYTFTQSVYKLIGLLQQGRRFDGVIFYGGANDVDYAYDANEAGALEKERAVRISLEGSLWDRSTQYVKDQVNACVLCLAGVILARNTPFVKDHLTPSIVRMRDALLFKRGQSGGDDGSQLAGAIAKYYVASHELLSRVASAYQLRFIDFWQPSLMLD